MQNKINIFWIKEAWNKFLTNIALYIESNEKNCKSSTSLTIIISLTKNVCWKFKGILKVYIKAQQKINLCNNSLVKNTIFIYFIRA